MSFTLPTPSQSFDVPLDDGARIKVRRHGNSSGARIFHAHGNGFAANAYYPYWQHLLADYDLILFDFRNHGENTPVEPANHTYQQLSRDLECVVQAVRRRFGEKPTAGIFHSMSGRTAMKHAIEIGWAWDALVLFDPPNVPPPDHPVYPATKDFALKLSRWARGRRVQFATVDELAAEYLQSRNTRNWVPGAHELMARSVLRKNPSGEGYVLVCAPENEAGIYSAALTLNLWPNASEFAGPVKLIGADPTMKEASAPALANQALGRENSFDYEFVAGTGHLLQIEKPDACVRATLAFFEKCRFGRA